MRIFFLALLFFSVTAALADENVTLRLAREVDRYYDHLSSLREKFDETYTGNGITRSEEGTLWLKRPGKMRWEYSAPASKVFVTDGHEVWFYVAGQPQAQRAGIKKLDDLRSPLRYLLGKTKLEKEFEQLSVAPSNGLPKSDVLLRGVPRGTHGRIQQAELEINHEHQIVRILVHELDGSTTEFRFHDVEPNAPASDSLFQFSPPPGVRVVESPELAQ